jgi:hypothetical protein
MVPAHRTDAACPDEVREAGVRIIAAVGFLNEDGMIDFGQQREVILGIAQADRLELVIGPITESVPIDEGAAGLPFVMGA